MPAITKIKAIIQLFRPDLSLAAGIYVVVGECWIGVIKK
jgi:hypothetical protein